MNNPAENLAIVYALKPGDHQAGVAFDSIHMGKVYRVIYLIQFASLTDDGVLTFKSGASAGTETTAENFRYRLADAAQGSATADTFAAWSADVATLTLTAATYQNKMLVCKVEARGITADQPWITGAFDSSASALNASVAAVCVPRFIDEDGVTVIT